MKKKFRLAAEKYLKQIQRRRNWRNVVLAMACVVVFCTTYAMILPAITLEKNSCGLEEHSHGESCYEKVLSKTVQTLACGYDSEDAHVHAAECFDAEGNPTCGKTEEPVHIHDEEACYENYLDEEGNEQKRLTCTLLAVTEHNHDTGCYVTEEVPADDVDLLTCLLTEGHVHAENCYDEAGILICEEAENHTHGDMCYGTWVLVCGQEEHTHTEECKAEEETEPNTLRYRGGDYEVIVRYEDSAGIPENAQLIAEEITGDAYDMYLKQTFVAMGYEFSDVSVKFPTGEDSMNLSSEKLELLAGPIGFARFFDLTILADGQPFEPEDTVEVTIRYDAAIDIPDGSKAAIHFTQSGEIEILNAEKTAPMQNVRQEEEMIPPETNGVEFVFLQDSFSVTGTIGLGGDGNVVETTLQKDMYVDWYCGEGEKQTLLVAVNFSGDFSDGKTITIKVPTGYQISAYTATDPEAAYIPNPKKPDQPLMIGEPVQEEYKDYVFSSELSSASLPSDIVGVVNGGSWQNQPLIGYTRYGPTDKNQSTYGYGGDIHYTLAQTTQTVEVLAVLNINQILLSHTSAEEVLEPIQVIVTSGGVERVTYIHVTATEVPVVNMVRKSSQSASVAEKGEKTGRTGTMTVTSRFNNQLSEREFGSYVDKAQFTMTYPEGVFLEQGTVLCEWFHDTSLSNSPMAKNLTNGEKVEIVKNHLWVEWNETAKGGGTVVWYVEKTFVYQEDSPILGATFTANTNTSLVGTKAYKDGDLIKGFTISMDYFERNGKVLPDDKLVTLTYERRVRTDDKKHVHITPMNYTRRDINVDFQTDDYTYALGGFYVDAKHASERGYADCTFYFENVNGLKVTALNLMGIDIRDVTVVTNQRVIPWKSYNNHSEYFTNSDDTSTVSAMYLELTKYLKDCGLQLGEGEYIKACLFTTKLQQKAYWAGYTVDSFIYFGQFQDGDYDGNREGDVTLRMLEDYQYTEYDPILQKYIAANNMDEITYQNIDTDDCVVSGANCPFDGMPVKATDHTKIGWTKTGASWATVSHKDANTGKVKTYLPNDIIEISTSVWAGYNMKHQDILIDPELIISLPAGVILDTSSVVATSDKGNYKNGNYLHLEQAGEARTIEVNGVTWTVYRFRVPVDERYALVAEERVIGGQTMAAIDSIDAIFKATVDPSCPNYDLDYRDIVMWDINNRGYNEKTMDSVILATKTAVNSGESVTYTDTRNVSGYGTTYKLVSHSEAAQINIHRNIGLNVDIAIKAVNRIDAPDTGNGYTIYNGLNSSIVPVIPGRYADVRVEYLATAESTFHEGTAIYVPIPKLYTNYTKFFQNINLTNPLLQTENKSFGFTMDLTGSVQMHTNDDTTWETYYGRLTTISNENGVTPDWEPVQMLSPGGTIVNNDWASEAETANWSAAQWAGVTMVKFVATGDVPANGTGEAVMTLYVRNIGEDGEAVGGTYNYWRGYSKTVTREETGEGNWNYTSVVAVTPIAETLECQLFIDLDKDGVYDSEEFPYTTGYYTVELARTDGTMSVRLLQSFGNGYYALKDYDGEWEYLPAGEYEIIVRRNQDRDFYFANSEYNGSFGKESPENAWHNNVYSPNDIVAYKKFVVNNNTYDVHRIGVALTSSATASLKGKKTFGGGVLQGGDFTFVLTPQDGAPGEIMTVKNMKNGTFTFDEIRFEDPGTYTYTITEYKDDQLSGIAFDGHTTTVTVTVIADSDNGKLRVDSITYHNLDAPNPEDEAITTMAAFTNTIAYELPETGGMGTTMFYVFGGIMMLAAFALLVTKKRMADAV